MPQSCTALDYHIVFGTKDRRPLITPEIQSRLYDYTAAIIKNLDGQVRQIGGVADHIHILARLHPSHALADVLRVVKTNSSKWVHETFKDRRFAWQTGYSAFTVSRSRVDGVRTYIANQERRHKRMTFKEELIALLERHEVEYDKRYIWA
jgi:putative transposase